MKTRIRHRGLALLLTLTMILGLMPAGIVPTTAEAAEALTVTYELRANKIADDAQKAETDPRLMTEYSGSRNWAYVADTMSKYWRDNSYNYMYSQGGVVGNWVALKIKISKTGTWLPNLTGWSRDQNCPVGLYFLPMSFLQQTDVTAAIDAEVSKGSASQYYGGTADFSNPVNGSSAGKQKSFDYNRVDLTQGEVILVIRADAKGGNATYYNYMYIYPWFLTFTYIESLGSIEASFENVSVGNILDPKIVYKNASGTAFPANGATYTLSTNDTDVFLTGTDGKLYAKKAGSASVKVSATYEGVTKETTVQVTVNTALGVSGAKQDFLFTKSAYGDGEVEAYTLKDYGANGRPWAHVADTTTLVDSNNKRLLLSTNYMPMSNDANQWTAWRIKIPAPGIYTASMSGAAYKNGGLAAVYMVPYDSSMTPETISRYITSDNLLGTMDQYNSSTITTTLPLQNSFVAVESEDYGKQGYKEYLMIIRGEHNPTNGKYYLHVSGVHLDGTVGLASVESKLASTELGSGESTDVISTIAKMLDGSIADASKIYVHYEAADPTVARVDAKTGKVTALKEGNTEILTYAFYNNVMVSHSIPFTVDDDLAISSVTVMGNSTALLGTAFRLAAAIKLANGNIITPADATLSFVEVSDPDGAVSISGDKVLADKVGTATLKATASYRGKTLESDVFTLTVSDNLTPLSGSTASYDLRLGAYGETDAEITAYSSYTDTRRWAYVSSGANISLSATGMEIASIPGSYVLMKISVPTAGRYQVFANTQLRTDGGIGDVYFLPADVVNDPAAIESYLIDIYKAGSIDFYGDGGSFVNLSDTELDTAGDYYMVLRASGKNNLSSGYGMYPADILLDGESVVSEVSLSLFETKLGIGESTAYTVTAKLSNGFDIPMQDTSVAVSSGDAGFAIDSAASTLTAQAEGSATITAAVTYKGHTAYGTAPAVCAEQYGVKNILLFGDDAALLGKPYILTPAIELNNNQLLRTDAQPEFSIISCEPAGAIELSEDGKSFVTRSTGIAQINAKITLRGKEYISETVTLPILNAGTGSPDVRISFNFTEYPGDSFSYPWQVTDYSKVRPWAYLTHKVVGYPGYTHLPQESLVQFTSGTLCTVSDKNDYIALKTKFNAAGIYQVNAAALGRNRSGAIGLYVFPLTKDSAADPTAFMNESTCLGVWDTYASSNTEMTTTYPKTLTITNPGEYVVVMRLDSRNASAAEYTMYMRSIDFLNMNEMRSAELTPEKDTVNIGESTSTALSLFKGNGDAVDFSPEDVKVIYTSADTSVATVDANGSITGIGEGTTTISALVEKSGLTATAKADISVYDTSEVLDIIYDAAGAISVYGQTQLTAKASMASGNTVTVPAESITYSLVCSPEGAASISENGILTGNALGTAEVIMSFSFHGKEYVSPPISVTVQRDSSINPTIFTYEERDLLNENALKYSWAKSEVEAAKAAGDIYLKEIDRIYDSVVPEGLFRYYHVGNKYDVNKFNCRYCGRDINSEFGAYGWLCDGLKYPWKIQCPYCRRRFPSNDFESFYKLGLSDNGLSWSRDQALQKHAELFEHDVNDEHPNVGYLKNDAFPEKDAELGVSGWAVDDGLGYRTGAHDPDSNKPETWYFVAFYVHEGIWSGTGNKINSGVVRGALDALSNAFLYTGDAKYGRAGAILLDRIADVYPGFDWYQWASLRNESYRGGIVDAVQECHMATTFVEAYDKLLPIYSDQGLIDYLSAKSEKYGLGDKSTPGALRKNVEDGILRKIHDRVLYGDIGGNFGMTQSALTAAAVALDKEPETTEWLNWLLKPGAVKNTGARGTPRTGGNILPKLVNDVSRDGTGNEASPGYNRLWISYLIDTAEYLHGYYRAPYDLYENPKFVKSFTSQIPLIMGGHYTAQVGDSGGYGTTGITYSSISDAVKAGYLRTRDPQLGQILYRINGNTVEGLHAAITERDPEALQREISTIVEDRGSLDIDSKMMTGYGIAGLKDGNNYQSVLSTDSKNTTRDFWMYFGYGTGHGHKDALNLGISAYGMNMAADLGYPEQTGAQPHRIEWVAATISHNTVVVDEQDQTGLVPHGTPMHFDDSGIVKVMDADASPVYSQTDAYRRTLVMVEADDDVSYGVDFFHVVGGDDHMYTFHSHTDEAETFGLNPVPQVDANGNFIGTYAGPDVEYGRDPSGNVYVGTYPHGYSWMTNIRRDTDVDGQFAVDFKIDDFRNILPVKKDLHLRMTSVNDFPLSEVTLALTPPPQVAGNPEKLEQVFIRRTGDDLNTLFTTVFEPYEGSRYIDSIEGVEVSRIEGRQTLDDAVRAVKVTHTNGRVDYIVYATNNKVLYDVGGLFNFRGFVGVYTLSADGTPALTYLNDGDTIAGISGANPAYTGKIADFTRDLLLDNTITLRPDSAMDVNALTGKHIYIENDGVQNGAYEIFGASENADGTVTLDIGDVTLIRAYKDNENIESGFVYNISEGQSFRIPLPTMQDSSPVFLQQDDKSIAAGKKLTITVSASSPLNKDITYASTLLPRGAAFDAARGVITWTPDDKQIGEHVLAISATDGTMTSHQYIDVEVFKSSGSTGTIPSAPSTSSTPSNPSGSGSGSSSGGVSGGGTTTPSAPSTDVSGTPNTGDANTPSAERFTDLGNHTWAKDAVYALVDAGVVNGTSETTFSPAANIKRADFAIMLVRAFKAESDSTDNFMDVDPDSYYAKELAIARACGIINGIGENKFNPDGEITRQDMMLMLARALDAKGYELADADRAALSDFADAAEIAEYAADAVSRLVNSEYVTGANGRIYPQGKATRAEVAVLLSRIFK